MNAKATLTSTNQSLRLLLIASIFLIAACNRGSDPAASSTVAKPSAIETTANAASTNEIPAPEISSQPAGTADSLPPPGTGGKVTPAAPADSDGVFMLKSGQLAQLDASTSLTYVRLVSDSRCPADAQCVWAGEVTIELLLDSGKEKKLFALTDNANTASMLAYKIELISVDRSHVIKIRADKIQAR